METHVSMDSKSHPAGISTVDDQRKIIHENISNKGDKAKPLNTSNTCV